MSRLRTIFSLFIFTVAVLLLSGCGGGSSSNGGPTNRAPIITMNSQITVDEGVKTVAHPLGSDPDGDALTWTISGPDAAHFVMSSQGALAFQVSPDYELPKDGDADNRYAITVRASDGKLQAVQDLIIIVSDVAEPGLVLIGPDAVAVPENSTAVTAIVTQHDRPESVALRLEGIDAAHFTLSDSGSLAFREAPNHERPGDDGRDNNYNLIVSGSDGTHTATMQMVVQVTDVPHQVQWDRTLGGAGTEAATGITTADSGGFLVSLFGELGIEDSSEETDSEDWDGWLIRMDDHGEVLWDRSYGRERLDSIYHIVPSGDGGYVFVGGWERSRDSQGDGDVWVVKIDHQGAVVWERTYGGNGFDIANDIVATGNGEFLVIASTTSEASGDISEERIGERDLWVLNISQNGGILWERRYGGSGFEAGGVAVELPGGDLMIGCSTDSPKGADLQGDPHGRFDYWLMRINPIGRIIWERRYGGSADDYLTELELAPNGDLFVCGNSNSPASGDKQRDSARGNRGILSSDLWLLRLDTGHSNLYWERTIGTSHAQHIRSLIVSDDGFVHTFGQTYDPSEPWGEREDLELMVVSPEGNLMSRMVFGSDGYEVPGDFFLGLGDRYTFAAHSDGDRTGDKTEVSRGQWDAWIVRLEERDPPTAVAQKPHSMVERQ